MAIGRQTLIDIKTISALLLDTIELNTNVECKQVYPMFINTTLSDVYGLIMLGGQLPYQRSRES